MKKIALLVSVCLLAVGFAACGNKTNDITEEPEEVVISESSDTQPEGSTEDGAATDNPVTDEPAQVMDAAMYRGTVTEIKELDDLTSLLLVLEDGAEYGPSPVQINVTEDTRLNFDLASLKKGDYLELYYEFLIASEGTEVIEPIAINHLGTAESRVYNGEVIDIVYKEDNPSAGSMTLVDLDGENETVFHFADDGTTQFYMDFADLEPGAKLNIFHGPAMTASLPPQSTALEVRPYVSVA